MAYVSFKYKYKISMAKCINSDINGAMKDNLRRCMSAKIEMDCHKFYSEGSQLLITCHIANYNHIISK